MSPTKKKPSKAKQAPARAKPAVRKKPAPTAKTATKAALKKKPLKKKTQTKPAAAKKAAAPATAKPVKAAAKQAAAKPGARAKKATSKPGKAPSILPADAHPTLGIKHTCYQCGAKFYDLFRAEPLCPKCGADQREAPKVEARVKPIAKPKRTRKVSMAPLLDDDEEEVAFDDDSNGPDLGLGQAGAAFDDPTEMTEDDSEV